MKIKNKKIIASALCALVGTVWTVIGFGWFAESASAENPQRNWTNFVSRSFGSPETATVIASGLNNPRGLTLSPDGAIYVAEAGSGGAGPCAPGPDDVRCYGTSGSITQIDLKNGAVSRIATGLPSIAPPGGDFAEGVHDVSFQGLGNLYFTVGFGGDPANRTIFFGQGGENLARIGRMTPRGSWTLQEDLGDFEAAVNPTGDEIDTNPYGLLAIPGKRVVADAGANDLV